MQQSPKGQELATQAAYLLESEEAVQGDMVLRTQYDAWPNIACNGFIAKWDALADSVNEPNAFAESWFVLPAFRQFDAKGEVRLFVLWDGEVLAGLMPLGFEARYGKWPIPHVQNWLHHNAFLGAPLVRKGYERAFWTALLAHLDAEPASACFAHFNGLVVDGPLVQALEEVCSTDKRRIALVHREERAFLDGDLTPEAYYETTVRSKKRKELRRQKNRLAEEGELSFARIEGDCDIDRWTNEFLVLERRGWKGANGSALDCADDTRNLFRAALAGAAARGKLERLELRLNSHPLAMLANFLCVPGSFSFKTAFDEDYARFSPGVLLQIENLDLLTRSGIDWCDSCAAEGHPMIDSLWTGRRSVGRYSVAIGGSARRALFGALLRAEMARGAARKPAPTLQVESGEDE